MRFCRSILLLLPFALTSLVGAFAPVSYKYSNHRRTHGKLHAATGAPQYDKRDAKLRQAEVVGKDTVMLHIEKDDDALLEYKPGHVLALEIEDPGKFSTNAKTQANTEKNGGWMRGPYTVSRGNDESFDILIKVVGDKSNTLASATPGTPLRFGGKFHVPIKEGIQENGIKRVILLSTGVGIGPCIGAIEEMIADKDNFTPVVELVASFRTEEDVVYREYLDDLAAKHPNKFQWKVVVTNEIGRISASEENVRMAATNDEYCSLEDTHYHVIGNGQLVSEWKSGLAKAGVPTEKVTFESYFNHQATSNEKAIDAIASAIAQAAKSPVV